MLQISNLQLCEKSNRIHSCENHWTLLDYLQHQVSTDVWCVRHLLMTSKNFHYKLKFVDVHIEVFEIKWLKQESITFHFRLILFVWKYFFKLIELKKRVNIYLGNGKKKLQTASLSTLRNWSLLMKKTSI